ncbi:DUF2975 domain-containing protein [Streptomyces sp. RS10V-4]|uniref:DUF2975 domain-containing protein n=1 Tax=Streptomyces rhizoryzae TaxID=2932493 RepID=UPI00200341F7|nr:DUF2975 domain-containing protein [Streptomyces rhizoryzae]MCK7624744.1 DUF2975 domain-containing protein [Streptomyces rhizoryzae]
MAILGVACVRVALAAGWRLLAMVRRGALFTPRAFRRVDLITGAATAATLLAPVSPDTWPWPRSPLPTTAWRSSAP